jgi:hypothetical protein
MYLVTYLTLCNTKYIRTYKRNMLTLFSCVFTYESRNCRCTDLILIEQNLELRPFVVSTAAAKAISKTRKGREMVESPENGCSRLFFIAIWLNLTRTRACTCVTSIEFKAPYFKWFFGSGGVVLLRWFDSFEFSGQWEVWCSAW